MTRQFQVVRESADVLALYLLDEDGVLWRAPLPVNPAEWRAISVPSETQHKRETLAEKDRFRRLHPLPDEVRIFAQYFAEAAAERDARDALTKPSSTCDE